MLLFLLALIIISALCVILSKNIIQSILYLILVFLLCSILFVYVGVDFIGLIILIVYIGAISVLFLFVVMMLNIRILEVYSTFSIYLPLAILLSCMFIAQIFLIYLNSLNFIEFSSMLKYINWVPLMNVTIGLIGQLLFNNYYILFIAATILLFIAMIGVIILTLNSKSFKSKQIINNVKLNSINWKYVK